MELRDLAHQALVLSKLEYACSVLDRYLTKDKDLLEYINRKVQCFVQQYYKRSSSTTKMLITLGWYPLETRRCQARLRLMDRIISSRVAVNLGGYLTEVITRTRSVNPLKFRYIYRKKFLPYKNPLFIRMISDWNVTPSKMIVKLKTSVSLMAD